MGINSIDVGGEMFIIVALRFLRFHAAEFTTALIYINCI